MTFKELFAFQCDSYTTVESSSYIHQPHKNAYHRFVLVRINSISVSMFLHIFRKWENEKNKITTWATSIMIKIVAYSISLYAMLIGQCVAKHRPFHACFHSLICIDFWMTIYTNAYLLTTSNMWILLFCWCCCLAWYIFRC